MNERVYLHDIPVDALEPADGLWERITGWLQHPQCSRQIVTLNALMLMTAFKDIQLRRVIQAADLITIDGFGIEIALKKRGCAQLQRIAGVALVKALLDWGADRGLSVFFYGGSSEVVKRLWDMIASQWPGLKVTGIYDGYAIELNQEQIKQEIISCQPRLLLVGLGTPAQEKFLAEMLPYLKGTVGIGVGGTFDILAGVKVESPRWIRSMGGEWLFRMLQEPRKFNGIPELIRFWRYFLW